MFEVADNIDHKDVELIIKEDGSAENENGGNEDDKALEDEYDGYYDEEDSKPQNAIK